MAQGEALVVVDASVAVKWFTREEFSDSAARLLAMHREGKVSLASPYLLTYEVANAVMARAGGVSPPMLRPVRAPSPSPP
ncbi:MAG: type II toxin-antitoxin system VapC family toxin, partial [Nitrososphaerota archaeon]|nr:type II toxin-antitoxin system VapC family toxin [Nitrososphaerota archaeon]